MSRSAERTPRGREIPFIDISVPVHPELPVWPGSPPVELVRRLDIDRGDPVNDTTARFGVHTGSHVDAPLHVIAGGRSVDALPLEVLIGPAHVVAVPDVDVVTSAVLAQQALPAGTRRLLLRTRNSALWDRALRFTPDYVALDAGAARWVVERGIQLLGVDYLSVQRFTDGPQTHQILLEAGVVVVEGLNLAAVAPGAYELICLPMRLVGAEGAPVRAVLRPLR